MRMLRGMPELALLLMAANAGLATDEGRIRPGMVCGVGRRAEKKREKCRGNDKDSRDAAGDQEAPLRCTYLWPIRTGLSVCGLRRRFGLLPGLAS